ncbi:unnamed protein product, partial [Prunus brigantina]
SSPKTRAKDSSSSRSPAYLNGDGVDQHAIEEMVNLFKKDAEAPLCLQSSSALASHSWVRQNLSRSYPSSEVRNNVVYFLELRFPDIVLLEDQVMALSLISAEVPKRSIEEYMMFFRHCIKSSATQWQVVLRRTYPWFQPGYSLFEKEPEYLELPFGDEEDQHETLAEQLTIEATPSAIRNKRKKTAQAQDSASTPPPPPPPTRSKRLRKKAVAQSEEIEEPTTVPTETSGTVEQEMRKKAKKLKKSLKAEAEHSITVLVPEVEEDRTVGTLAVVTSPFKPPIVAVSIMMLMHSIPGSSTTAFFADPELVEFETMDLDTQLDKLEKLSSTPDNAKSKVVDEVVDIVKIWQSTKLDLHEDNEAVDQLMKDLDLLHRENMAPRPILEISLGLAKNALNFHNRYEDLRPSFNASKFCKATHEANLVDYQKQTTELDVLVADYKETKSTIDKLEKHIEELHKQLARLREWQKKLGAGLGTKTKATFLVQNMVSASRPALEIAEDSIYQGVLLQKEITTKKIGLQKTLRKLGL